MGEPQRSGVLPLVIALATMACLCVAGVVAAVVILGGDASWQPFEYLGAVNSGDRIQISPRVSFRAPQDYNGAMYQPEFGGLFDASQEALLSHQSEFPRDDSDSVFVIVAHSSRSLSRWERMDATSRSRDATSLPAAASSSFSVENGWGASVTTSYGWHHGKTPYYLIVASLSHPEERPIRVQAIYREPSHVPSAPPDPRTAYTTLTDVIDLELK